jgi:hypothetical protein
MIRPQMHPRVSGPEREIGFGHSGSEECRDDKNHRKQAWDAEAGAVDIARSVTTPRA